MRRLVALAPWLVACGASVSPGPDDASGGGGADSTSAITGASAGQTSSGSGTVGSGGASAGGGGSGVGSGGGSGGSDVAGLGMNDVSFLLPLPAPGDVTLLRASDPGDAGEPILPRDVHDRAIEVPDDPGAIGDFYDDLQIVAVRFDLCDRAEPGPCPVTEDGRLRVVFQPILEGNAADEGIHAFYAIPADELDAAVADLTALHALRGTDPGGPLGVNDTVASDATYRDALRAFVARHADPAALVRVTAMGQVVIAAALRWAFHGLERKDGELAPIVIPDAGTVSSEVLLLETASYDLTPPADSPPGALVGLSQSRFDEADDETRDRALRALVAIDDPLTHVPNTLQCAACHLATVTLPARAASIGVDPATLPGRYTSSYDLSIDGGASAVDDALLRGFGYRGTTVAITQRVVNETAQVLEELAARY